MHRFEMARGQLRTLSWVLASLLLVACADDEAQAPSPATGDLLITGVLVVDAGANVTSPPQDILITGGRIVEVAASGSIAAERAESVFLAEGMFALPGLIDVHAHIGDGGIGDQSVADREGALSQFVRYGVTTIFAPGGGAGNDDWLARWKQRCGDGELLCPGIYGSGALITAPGSHPIGTIWNFPDDIDPAVVYERGAVAVEEDEPVGPLLDRKQAMGVDAIKIVIEDGIGPRYPMPRLSNAKIVQLVEASHQRGLRIFAHVSMPEHVADGVAAGVDGVMHSAEEPIADDILATMAKEGMFYVATLALYDGFFDRVAGQVGAEHEPYALAGSSPRAIASLKDLEELPFTPEVAEVVMAAVRDNLRRAAAAGVSLALGTDVNNPTVFPGYSAHEELALMVEAGLTPAQALVAATKGGAAFLEKDSSLGKIAPGYEADLLLLAENPLVDIVNTRTLLSVISDGQVIEDVVSLTDQASLVLGADGR